jgi:type VI secretion system protein ImpF
MLRDYVPDLPDHIHTSVFDRLIDPNPDLAHDAPESNVQRFRRLKEMFRRDLEALLNTRACVNTPPVEYEHLAASLLNYGVSDFIGASVITSRERERMAAALEGTISVMEPRFREVKVTVLEPREKIERVLRLRISAVVILKEGMQPLSFETALDPSTRHFAVTGEDGR